MRLRTPGEFVYAYGQLKKHVFAATNTGGVYSFDGDSWKVWREPDGVSYQIYSMINFDDRLLMGQYPTGNLFEFDGSRFQLLPNQPPVMSGVSPNAREAQTLTIYGGDLYAGRRRYAPDEAGRRARHPGEWSDSDVQPHAWL